MTSRLRGPSAVKDTPRAAPFAKDHFHRSEAEVHSSRSCKNDGRGNRYHFGMSKQHDNKVERNGQEYNKNFVQAEENNADLLYKKSREHFGSWDIKDVQDDTRKSRKQDLDGTQLTNGKFRSEPVGAKPDKSHDRPEYRDEGYVGSLPREGRQKGEFIERNLNGSYKSRMKESWEEEVESRNRGRTSKISRSNDSNNDLMQPVDERDILLKEIENLATDGSQSPDRRIQAMIERLKSREESKLRSKREQRSASPEKEAHDKTKSDGRNDIRSPIIDYPHDNLSNARDRKLKDDRDDEPRRSSESKLIGKCDREEDAVRRERSTDRKSRSSERRNETCEPRRDDSFRKTSNTYSAERNYRRKSIEDEENHPRSRDNSSKRRSYIYEGSPEDFDVRIQRYDRALLEPRRDLDRSSPRRSSSREPHLTRKESLKEYTREPITKKNSFKAESKRTPSKDRGESNLARKTSFKDVDNDTYKKHVSKNPHESSIKYFGKDQEDSSCKNSFKDVSTDINRKDFFSVRDGEFDRTFLKDQNDDAKKRVSSMEHAGGVSRIVLRNDDESSRSNSFKNVNEDSGKKNSFKEKNVEFGEISYKDHERNSERRKNSFKDDDKEFRRTLYHDYENNIDRKTANDRYIEFGKVSFKTQDDELRVSSPLQEENNKVIVRTSSFKERDASPKRRPSLRSRDHETFDRKSDNYSRALSPSKKDEAESNTKNSKNFCAKSWYESNRIFSAKYLRDHSKVRNAPEGQLDVDVSPEREFLVLQDTRGSTVETTTNDPEENRFETRGGIDSGDSESPRFSSARDRNGTTIIRIRSSEDSGSAAERRRRRRPAQEICAVRPRKYEDDDEDSDEDEEEDRWRRTRRDGGILPGRGGGDASGATPSRTIWNYREGVWHFHESIAFDRSFMVQRREAFFINRWRR
ncbi:PREDICTED: intracellular protein transport protein USO1-like [Cyphomyrmex costatus]|uniref:intracellular protein transport protein USO1-like n=1 Tax=Cyphomyrmex costatus TaxID=456900 RepID=UPI000852410D|nr:PREDICTED: intracellular protein transport protein USO1-like [Cyphomyrmex costatus]